MMPPEHGELAACAKGAERFSFSAQTLGIPKGLCKWSCDHLRTSQLDIVAQENSLCWSSQPGLVEEAPVCVIPAH